MVRWIARPRSCVLGERDSEPGAWERERTAGTADDWMAVRGGVEKRKGQAVGTGSPDCRVEGDIEPLRGDRRGPVGDACLVAAVGGQLDDSP